MVKTLLKRYRKFRFLATRTERGFTLLELLVAMVVAGLISAGLLFMVVQLIQTNLREAARSDTQRDLQSAIDYIARDVREAVFVYDATCLLDRPSGADAARCPGLRSYLPAAITESSNNIPVLAFWRLDPLPGQSAPPTEFRKLCKDQAAAYSRSGNLPTVIEGVPCLSGQIYTLVVYSLNNDPSRTISQGRARIMRYELPQFTSGSLPSSPTSSPTATQGWVSPRARVLTSTGSKETSFLSWPVNKSSLLGGTLDSLQTARPTGSGDPLTDFVDWFGLYEASSRGRAPEISEMVLTPANGSAVANDPPRGFYVYVRGGNEQGDLNQEVIIRIQGDAAGRPGIPNIGSLNRPIAPISLETRVLTRGVTNKTQ
ncbi:prepilin-type N-terminal cleavage/methylation domain-containing protein [Leptolyngbya sp. NIES-2104]|uniref:prepilin-type N-terminal cleavage/methylation domain-containing protein n=1 Tax=Leptolyngbya sp. NIES-2104 TaxID=1552121 RepID=UPI0006ECB90B|nr:prepilin-type N-terminal cleavage/methylation domain-containing protein [Leptolyngbya sp. NIES-2104]GAP96387.1 hypothetical protein NIES2104_29240 [Leptolyngbya sp. NIES-2104]